MSALSSQPLLRDAVAADMAAVAAIYRPYVETSTATFEMEPPDATEMTRRWEKIVALGAPYLVAEIDGRVVGYAYAGAYRARPAYARTVEDSIYLAQDCAGRGIGRMLLDALVAEAGRRGFTQMIAVITGSGDGPSVKLHHACGFVEAGCLKAVGHKFDQWLDTILMQRAL